MSDQKDPGYRVCVNCVMDTTDPDITFDADGVCSHCTNFRDVTRNYWFPNEEGGSRLEPQIRRIREEGRGREYDCIIGLSGGVDSSYVAYKAVEMGLRPLALHVDAGWNSELAVNNIESIVKTLDIDLHTVVIDWEEMRDLQAAFIRASVANQDVPQDHCFTATLYREARTQGIKYVLNGSNYATESIMPQAWGYNAMDSRHLRAIHRRFGKRRLKSYPTIGFFEYYVFFPYIYGIKVVRPLNFMPYDKDEAIRIMSEKMGWKYYGGKHFESRFTKFFQAYYLPRKFGYDKRRAHLSSLIVSGQMTREQALAELEKPLYAPDELRSDRDLVIKKLGFTEEEFAAIEAGPNRTYRDYPSNEWLFRLKNNVRAVIGRSR